MKLLEENVVGQFSLDPRGKTYRIQGLRKDNERRRDNQERSVGIANLSHQRECRGRITIKRPKRCGMERGERKSKKLKKEPQHSRTKRRKLSVGKEPSPRPSSKRKKSHPKKKRAANKDQKISKNIVASFTAQEV